VLLYVPALTILAIVSFVVGQWLISEYRIGQAQTRPHGEVAKEEIEADLNKPRFVGERNGFSFFNPGDGNQLSRVKAWSPKCDGTNVKESTEGEARADGLYFDLAYVPDGLNEQYSTVTACEDDAIAMSRTYTGGPAGLLQVYRAAGPAAFPVSSYPEDRLESTEIAGLPSLVGHPIEENGRTVIYLRDGETRWRISGFQLSLDELIKVAEGVR
jgi:hypothetical protein